MATINGRVQKVKSPAVSLLRDLFFGVLRLLPPAQRWIRDMKYIPKPFLRSALVYAGAENGRGDEHVGRLHPNPGLAGAPGLALDALLGTGFAIVGVAPDRAAPLAVQKAARAWEAPLVAVHRQDGTPRQVDTTTISAQVADGRYDPLFREYTGQWLLVRPDRVIAAAASADALGATLAGLWPLLFESESSASDRAPWEAAVLAA
jgi:3-(3-hydroxy-phenyl)propionate hydroxylase